MKTKSKDYRDFAPLTRTATDTGRAKLATKYRLLGMRGIIAAQKIGTLKFSRLGRSSVWGVTDLTSRATIIRHLDGPKPRSGDGTILGDVTWPIGIHEALESGRIVLVVGPENFLAAQNTWLNSPMHSIVCMPSTEPIAAYALPLFRGKTVILADLNDRKTNRAYGRWEQQLTKASAIVRRVDDEGWRFVDGRPARSLIDIENIKYQLGNQRR